MMNYEEMDKMSFAELTDEDMEQIAGGAKSVTVTALKEANIRAGAGAEYLIIGKTIPGHTATFMGVMKQDKEGRTWIKVAWKGNTGWVQAKFCRMNPVK